MALYPQTNNRKRLLSERGTEVSVRQKRSKSSVSTEAQAGPPPIVYSLPKTLQAKGEPFLAFLQSLPGFKITEKGAIFYGNRRVEGSIIVHIVDDFVRERPSNTPAKGWQLVAKALKEHNVPKEFVGNCSRWQYIQNVESSPNPTETSTPRNLSKTLSDINPIRDRLQFQSGSGIRQVLRQVK